ncbi:MAG: hypothetical protein IM328_06640 [Microcystis sp. M034S1]|uniref:hypothetical protein n=1 Tax=Microcystis sp. M034S1 TaxID=2771111 RepID=UPI002582BED7|nr:hypothetical protein [Microcystis sp. M034S1]MCA2909085.1 hypothetical protein [Microcystis sp. M034S1]
MFRTSVGAIREKLAKLPQQSNASRRQSSEDAKRRKSTLRAILRKLKQGGHVQNRQLQTWLTEEEFAEFEMLWAEQRELRAELKRKPPSIVEYEVLLKRGLFAEAKADGYKRVNAKAKAKALNDAQRHFELAIEFLTEQLQLDPSLALWVDRNMSDLAKDAAALCGSAMPRCVTSRSADKASGGLQSALQRKNDVKIAVVAKALERCG